MREIAQDIGAIGLGTLGLAVGAVGTGATARGSGGIGIRSVSGGIGVADTVPGAEEAVPDTVRVGGSLGGRRAKAGLGHVLRDPGHLPEVRAGESAGSREPARAGSGYNL